MRHAPFFGWIQDLAAPDPDQHLHAVRPDPVEPDGAAAPRRASSHLGIWPLIMGVTMWVQMRLNPPPPDPTQAMIFNWMPVIFTFMLGTFPAGLVIYWAWNNFAVDRAAVVHHEAARRRGEPLRQHRQQLQAKAETCHQQAGRVAWPSFPRTRSRPGGCCSPGLSLSSKAACSIADLPPTDRMEIAFAGRSNVGKSSLINALTGTPASPGPRTRRAARRSSTSSRRPRRPLRIVDMPGYGFAQGAEAQGRGVDQADPQVPHRPAEPAARLCAGRWAARRQGQRPLGDERARQGGGELPGGADQGRQAVAPRSSRPRSRRPKPRSRSGRRRIRSSSSPRARQGSGSRSFAPRSRRCSRS